MKYLQLTLTLIFLFQLSSQFPQANKVLILIDNIALETTHSIFFNELKGKFLPLFVNFKKEKGYDIDIKMINSLDTKFQEYGEYLYDHLILFCTSESGFNILF